MKNSQKLFTATLLAYLGGASGFSSLPSSKSTSSTSLNMGLLDFLGLGGKSGFDDPCVMGDEEIMSPKAHGTSATPVMENLRWECECPWSMIFITSFENWNYSSNEFLYCT